MASNIVPDTIDDTYPVAGEDNDSQGFRDNFNIIKTNFTYAKSEIENLQNDTAKTNADNVFFENTLERFTASRSSTKFSAAEMPTGGPNEINFENGHFHEITLSADVNPIRIINFPTNSNYAELFILLKGNGGGAWTATFQPRYINNTIDSEMHVIDGSEFSGGKSIDASLVDSESKLIKCFTYDNGVNVFFEFLGKFIVAA